MYDRFSMAVVAAVAVMILVAFFIVIGVMQPHPGTAPPVAEPPVVTTSETGPSH